MTLLLDTHVWVWYLENDRNQLSKKVTEHVEAAEAANDVFVSDISFWEVANKSAKEKLLSTDAILWLQRAAEAPGLAYMPIERSALIQSTRLAGMPPRDPADRILIAIAQMNGATLVTADKEIIDYARQNEGLSVYDARK
jgi:PIN domain nuclease of toxin-antitoxin system